MTNNPFINSQLDQNWLLQGRIIPPSCSAGDGCILHLQAKYHSWAEGHFHTGRVPLNCEAGVEFATTLLLPPDDDLIRDSLSPDEVELDYLAMAKLSHPDDTIAFLTVRGLTIVIQNDGLGRLFGPSEKCSHCGAKQESSAIMVSGNDSSGFDPLMQLTGKEKSH